MMEMLNVSSLILFHRLASGRLGEVDLSLGVLSSGV